MRLSRYKLHSFLVICFIVLMVLLAIGILSVPGLNDNDHNTEDLPLLPSSTMQTIYETTAPMPTITVLEQPLLFPEVSYTKCETIADAFLLSSNTEYTISLLHEALASDLYSQEAIVAMEAELARLESIFDYIQYDIKCFSLWEEKLEEFPYATKTWIYLKELGYSDVACAGILGNIMIECGGHTLKLQPFVYDKNKQYYGMFQWSQKYCPETADMSFEEQLDYFAKTVQPTFKTWGKKYAAGFTHDDFNKLESPRDAALAFAKIYERCASWSYERRQEAAERAYQYFVKDFEVV